MYCICPTLPTQNDRLCAELLFLPSLCKPASPSSLVHPPPPKLHPSIAGIFVHEWVTLGDLQPPRLLLHTHIKCGKQIATLWWASCEA